MWVLVEVLGYSCWKEGGKGRRRAAGLARHCSGYITVAICVETFVLCRFLRQKKVDARVTGAVVVSGHSFLVNFKLPCLPKPCRGRLDRIDVFAAHRSLFPVCSDRYKIDSLLLGIVALGVLYVVQLRHSRLPSAVMCGWVHIGYRVYGEWSARLRHMRKCVCGILLGAAERGR